MLANEENPRRDATADDTDTLLLYKGFGEKYLFSSSVLQPFVRASACRFDLSKVIQVTDEVVELYYRFLGKALPI